MTSPSKVTILPLKPPFFIEAADFKSLATITLPRRYSTALRHLESHSISSHPTPRNPAAALGISVWDSLLTDNMFKGRNVALPDLFALRCSTAFCAASSVSATTFWMAPPRAASIAASNFSGTFITSLTTPSRPFFLPSYAPNRDLTARP